MFSDVAISWAYLIFVQVIFSDVSISWAYLIFVQVMFSDVAISWAYLTSARQPKDEDGDQVCALLPAGHLPALLILLLHLLPNCCIQVSYGTLSQK